MGPFFFLCQRGLTSYPTLGDWPLVQNRPLNPLHLLSPARPTGGCNGIGFGMCDSNKTMFGEDCKLDRIDVCGGCFGVRDTPCDFGVLTATEIFLCSV